ncbi:CPBP family intramembrane glutamic endopeptidase [Clostridium sp. MSJ-8]|uniref:CPBP family intramembrane glutamic endopeptidase n=1 Tax=Clostridium sp. MSJ-8 TaxID=2841510 RepID=UPI0034609F64
MLSQIKKTVYVMILFPCCEELIYRYFLYMHMKRLVDNIYLYFILSVVTFVFIHFFNQKIKCFYKIPFAIFECITFILFKNIFVCIMIHMNFNILVYAYNTIKYSRGRIS